MLANWRQQVMLVKSGLRIIVTITYFRYLKKFVLFRWLGFLSIFFPQSPVRLQVSKYTYLFRRHTCLPACLPNLPTCKTRGRSKYVTSMCRIWYDLRSFLLASHLLKYHFTMTGQRLGMVQKFFSIKYICIRRPSVLLSFTSDTEFGNWVSFQCPVFYFHRATVVIIFLNFSTSIMRGTLRSTCLIARETITHRCQFRGESVIRAIFNKIQSKIH